MNRPPLTKADMQVVLKDYPDVSKAEAAAKRRASGVRFVPVNYGVLLGGPKKSK